MRFLARAIIKEIERRELLGARKATDRLLPFLLPFFSKLPGTAQNTMVQRLRFKPENIDSVT